MKIALLNDTHFGCRNDSPAFIEYQNKFYNDLFFPYLQHNNIKTLIFSSSAIVYGDPQYLPMDEKHSLNLTKLYENIFKN